MRKFAKLLIPALLVVAIVVSCTVMFASAEEPTVLYISANGAPNGTGTKDDPIGHSNVTATLTVKIGSAETPHAFENASFAEVQDFIKTVGTDTPSAVINGGGAVVKAHALYKAFDLLKNKVGTIVIMDEIALSSGDRTQNSSAAEFQLPSSTGSVTLTSNYGGVDYRTTGAKLVLDHSKFNSPALDLRTETTWKDINIEYKYLTKYTQGGFELGYSIYAGGHDLTIAEGVNVTSYDATAGKAGTRYPNLFLGRRYGTVSGDAVLTVKSGTWTGVFAAGHGMNNTASGNSQSGMYNGNATINIEGGKITTVNGSGSSMTNRQVAVVHGNVAINITGGTVDTVVGASSAGVDGDVDILVKSPANVTTAVAVTGNGQANTIDIKYDKAAVSAIKVEGFTTIDPPYDPNEVKVVYVAANGTGDGSTPESPLGHASDYQAATDGGNDKKNAMYLAADKLKSTGGVICIVGEVAISEASSRNGLGKAPGEFSWPGISGEILITSTYGGVDYAKKNGAKLVLDYSVSAAATLPFTSKTTIENIDILYKYTSVKGNGWKSSFMFGANGYELTIGENVNVTSFDVAKNAAGDRYPTILGGHRYSKLSRSPKVTIKSGTWETVIAGSFGMESASNKYGEINGNVTLIVDGGKIGEIYGTGSTAQPNGSVLGKVTITLNGGEVDRLYVANSSEYLGEGSVITIGKNVKINFADYAVKDYSGDLADLKSRVTFVNNNTVEIGKEPEREPDVVYVSDNGTGDGSSPESPLGTDPGNVVASDSFKGTAFYKAMEKLTKYGGYIVVVGDTAINSAESRVEGANQSPSELPLPKLGGELIVTSVYKGVDYRTNGAKLILDQDACAVAFVTFKSDVRFENLNIQHKYNLDDTNGWGTPMVLAANGNELVVESSVNVTAWDAAKNVEGNWYPAIIGGHRYLKVNGDTNVTIKGGNWAFVNAGGFAMSATHTGTVVGNATLNVEGGKIEAIYGTSSHEKPYGIIEGKLEINVTGGSVDAIYAAAKNGAENEIVINVAKTADRVAKIWGGVSEASTPANLTVNYDRSVTRDDEVKYINTEKANITGAVEDQPAPIFYTLYVSDVEKGRGDGSSPENAIGHAADYKAARAKALSIIAANGGTNSGLKGDNLTAVNTVYKKNALYRALTYNGSKIVKQGGVIVVCGTLTIDSTDAMRKSLADFWAPAGAETITITSVNDGVDYRWKGARLVLDTSSLGLCVELGSPTVFDHITIEHRYNSKNGKSIDNGAIIAARGNKLTVGYDVQVVANDVNPDEDARIEMFPSICGGHRYSDSKADCYVTVGSGNWAAVVGGDWGKNHTGNATIGINGGKIGTVCGTIKPTASGAKNIFDGSVWIGLWAGEVDNVIVVAKPGMKWGDASIGLGGTKVNGKIRATHADYSGEEIQAWVFNYTDAQIDTDKVIGFESPVPATGSYVGYVAVVAVVALAGAALLISKKRKHIED